MEEPRDAALRVERVRGLRWIVALVSLALSFGSAEVALRLLPTGRLPEPPPPAEIDPYYDANPFIVQGRSFLYSHIPGAHYTQARAGYRVPYHINSAGFRGPDVPSRPPAGMQRLLVLGDSVVEGHGVAYDEAFPALLGSALRSSGWDVVSAGVQGSSPIYYAANRNRYLRLSPDAVLLLVNDNDLSEDRNREAVYDTLPYLVDEGPLCTMDLAAPWTRSKLLQALGFLGRRLRLPYPGDPVPAIVTRNRPPLIQVLSDEQQKRHSSMSAGLVAPSVFALQWEMSARYLDAFADALAADGVALYVAYISFENLDPYRPSVFKEHALRVAAATEEWARRRGLPYHSVAADVLEAFRERRGRELVIVGDGHPSREGHVFLQERFESFLEPLTAPPYREARGRTP